MVSSISVFLPAVSTEPVDVSARTKQLCIAAMKGKCMGCKAVDPGADTYTCRKLA